MMGRVVPALLVLACTSLPLAAAAQAPAVPPPLAAPPEPSATRRPLSESLTGQAATDYRAARILFDDGDYTGAAIKFDRAYDASRDPRLLWNVAACEKNLRHYAKVAVLLDRYLAEAGATMPPDHRAEVDEVVKTVKWLISTVIIRTSEPGVLVYVDDEPVGSTPLPGPITLDLGRRTFKLTKPGWKAQQITRDVAGGSQFELDIALERIDDNGQLRVIASVGQAIRIDGQVVGDGQWNGTLPAGEHNLRVTANGMRTYDKSVTVIAGETRTQYVTLDREASAGVPAWVWIGGSVVVAGGLATAGYFLFRGPREIAAEQGSLAPSSVSF